MGKWESKSTVEKQAILEELVKRIADQMVGVIDAGEHKQISDSIVVSSGDLSENISMFRLDDNGLGLFQVGIVSRNSGIDPNIVVGIRVTSVPDLGDFVLAIRGVVVEDYGMGYYTPLERREDGILLRKQELIYMDKNEDIGRIEDDLIHPFLRGRYASEPPPRVERKNSRPRRTLEKLDPGSFWIEVRK